LPAKFANISKINYANIVDQPPNPLKQGISHNHKQGTNPKATRKLSAHETIKPPRCQASKRLVIPYKVKEGSKARKRKKQRKEASKASETRSPIQEKQSPRLMNE
jgi:hypothetical protein